jgi:hypothetical protein
MTQDTPDLVLAALLTVAHDVAPELPKDLLRKAYAIQRTHQFDRDRTVSLQNMQRLADEYVNSLSSSPTGREPSA